MAIRDFGDAHTLFEKIVQAKAGYIPSSKPSKPEVKYEEDPIWKALDLYGFK